MGRRCKQFKGLSQVYLSSSKCAAIAQELKIENFVVGNMLESMANYLRLVGQFKESVVSYQRALKISKQEMGVDHINSANIIMHMGLSTVSKGSMQKLFHVMN